MPTHTILPGVNALGCGFNPFVDTATQYKPTLLTFDYAGDAAQYQNANAAGTYTDAAETQYSVPKGVTINPGGAGSQESGDVYESRQEVEESFAAKAGVSGGFGLFSGSVNASYSTSTKATQESYFCRKWRHVSLWSLSLSEHLVDLNKAVDPRFIEITKALPSGHKTEAERKKWDTFFDRYGTHYIAGCQVGGEATLTVTLQKSQKSTKQSVQADMEIAYGSYFKGTGSASRDKTSDDFRKNSHINKIFEGGKPTSVDPENDPNALDAWANTVIDTPASRDFTMQPI
ncbi:MAG: MAC/perforin domain-containing protein, partial [Pseudomonadota bacterium]